MDDEPPPDAFVKALRFACGFVAGWVVAFLGVWFWDALPNFWILGAFFSLSFGVLAMRYGDAFWESLGDWIRWW